MSYFPRWRQVDDAVPGTLIAPDERLSWPKNWAMGAQHVVAMFGSTVLAPLLMGFDPNVAILMSGFGTLIFFLFVGGRVPSYLGSSFAFIGGVVAVTGYAGSGANANIGVALGAIIACGVVYTLIGLVVWAAGKGGARWIEALMPPVFRIEAMSMIAQVAIILVAENLGHVKAVAAMTGRPMDQYMGRAFVGDGVATMVSGAVGGTGVTTYAENIGVMAVTRIYSSLVFVLAALIAIVLGFSPKFGALIQTIPGPVLGGMSVVVFGLIAIAGARIWVVNKVDFSDNRNLITAAVTLVLGAGDFTLKFGVFHLGGIGTATFGAILLYALLRAGGRAPVGATPSADAEDAR